MVANSRSRETQRRAGRLRAELQYGRIDEILATGLHAYLTQFLDASTTSARASADDFLVPPHERRTAAPKGARCPLGRTPHGAKRPVTEHSRRAEPRHALRVRPPRRLVAAGRAPASGAALPHADPVATRCASSPQSIHQLAAGSVQSNYLARLVFPEQDHASFEVEVDLVAEMAVYNPFDFFLEPTPSSSRSPTTTGSCAGAAAVPRDRAADAALRRRISRASTATPRRTIDFLVDAQPAAAAATSAT